MSDPPTLELGLDSGSGKASSGATAQPGQRSETKGPCNCGYKHWLDGVEYDFVFHLNIGPIGYSVGDNPYETATNFLLIHGVPDWESQSASLGDWLLQVTSPLIEKWEQQQKQNPGSQHLVTSPPSSQAPSSHPQHEATYTPIKLSPEEEKAAAKLREEYKKQVARQKTEEEKKKEELRQRIEMDRKEINQRKAAPSVTPSSYIKSSSGSGGMHTLQDTKKKKEDEHEDNDHEHVEVDEEKMQQLFSKDPYPTKWDNPMVLYKYRELGPDGLKQHLTECGAQKELIQQVLQWAHSYTQAHPTTPKKPQAKSFGGAGHRLGASTALPSSTTVPSAPIISGSASQATTNELDETFQAIPVTLKESSPQTQIRVALANGSTITVVLNEDHTVLQLVQHIRHTTNASTAFQLIGGYPRKRVDVGDNLKLTIKQAGLAKSSIQQLL